MRRRVRISPSTIRNGRASQIRWRTQAQASRWTGPAAPVRSHSFCDCLAAVGSACRTRRRRPCTGYGIPLSPTASTFAMKGTRFGRSNRSRTFAQSRADADKATRTALVPARVQMTAAPRTRLSQWVLTTRTTDRDGSPALVLVKFMPPPWDFPHRSVPVT